ncbi:hypothetical protein G7046_g2319 [Stylonectria norvegica]|nr:hypothetical protein G7046_g2319 [Stylonectria norvegica]
MLTSQKASFLHAWPADSILDETWLTSLPPRAELRGLICLNASEVNLADGDGQNRGTPCPPAQPRPGFSSRMSLKTQCASTGGSLAWMSPCRPALRTGSASSSRSASSALGTKLQFPGRVLGSRRASRPRGMEAVALTGPLQACIMAPWVRPRDLGTSPELASSAGNRGAREGDYCNEAFISLPGAERQFHAIKEPRRRLQTPLCSKVEAGVSMLKTTNVYPTTAAENYDTSRPLTNDDLDRYSSQAQFERAKWRIAILLPSWVLQIALTMTMIGLFGWRLGDTMKNNKSSHVEITWEVTNIIMAVTATNCTFYEIIKFMAESLTPWTMLFSQIIKLTAAIAVLALDAVVYVHHEDRHYSLVGLGLDCVFILVALILAAYSVRAYIRLSKYDDYSHPVNVKNFGFNDDLERDTSYSSKRSMLPTMDKRLSLTSSRLSISSTQADAVPLQPLEKTPSLYSHKRDTQFDDYVARRGSISSAKDGERAVSGDFSWAGTPKEETAITRPRGASMPRAVSWTSERGLVSVPEEDDEPADKEKKDKRDHEALLGGGQSEGQRRGKAFDMDRREQGET